MLRDEAAFIVSGLSSTRLVRGTSHTLTCTHSTHTHTHTQATGKALNKPAASCECVAHLGWCSHQLALGFLFTNFLKTFPLDTKCDEFRRVYPPSVFSAQREGCPWSYAVGKSVAEATKCFDHLKWGGKKKPSAPRDTVQLLVARVKDWKDRWFKLNNTKKSKHVFAHAEVGCGWS